MRGITGYAAIHVFVLACVNIPMDRVKFGVKSNFRSLLFLNILSILHEVLNFLSYEASKMGIDFLDTL